MSGNHALILSSKYSCIGVGGGKRMRGNWLRDMVHINTHISDLKVIY